MRDADRKIGSFMIGVGAIIELKGTNKILIGKRDTHEVHHGEWEITYGRIDHHEDLTVALKREVFEETGITDLKIKTLNRIWHVYRGNKHVDTEIFGFTFVCETEEKNPKMSAEHSQFMWIEPEKAIEMITVPGIKQDLELYIKNKKVKTNVTISDLNNQTTVY